MDKTFASSDLGSAEVNDEKARYFLMSFAEKSTIMWNISYRDPNKEKEERLARSGAENPRREIKIR